MYATAANFPSLARPTVDVDEEAPTTLYVTRPPRPVVSVEAVRTAAPSQKKSRRWMVDLAMTAIGSLLGVYLGSAAIRAHVADTSHQARVSLHLVPGSAPSDALVAPVRGLDVAASPLTLEGSATPDSTVHVQPATKSVKRIARRGTRNAS